MKLLFIEYPTCSTCQKAKKFLLLHKEELITRHIVEETPTTEELKAWYKSSGLPLKKFFNTNGLVYKEKHLKEIIDSLSKDEQLALLASNGMLLKRPIVVYGNKVLVGFNEENYKKLCS